MIKTATKFVGFLANCDNNILTFNFGNAYVVKTAD